MFSPEYCRFVSDEWQSSVSIRCENFVSTWRDCQEYWGPDIWGQCFHYLSKIRDESMIEERLEAPMPWIGMYIAAASAVCSLAMAGDAFSGFRNKKYCFPCKYFSLNAFSLTVLTVAMKLTVDLTTSMKGINDKIANLSSLVMMSTAIGNFMTSVATMGNNEILLNITALGILVITIVVNVCIHNWETSDYFDGEIVFAEEIGAVICMFLLLVILCSYAVVVPTTKRYLEAKYSEMQKIASTQRALVEPARNFAIDELRVLVKKNMVMAETGSPQFVMARSVISVISGVICLLMALTLVEAHVRIYIRWNRGYSLWNYTADTNQNDSNYRWSTNWILYIQYGGVAIGTLAPLLRGFLVVLFWSLNCTDCRSFKKMLKIEAYWIQMLVEWREISLPLQIRHYQCKKILHDVKWLLLNVCIGIQIVIILTSKLLLLFFVICAAAALPCFRYIVNKLKSNKHDDISPPNDTGCSESEINFSSFVLLLEGEPQLRNKTLTSICNEADDLIEMGRRQRPENLIKFLRKSQNFNGVKEFDTRSTKVPSLHSVPEPPNCWSLPVVNLTSIAIAISSSVSFDKVKQLVSSVSEGLALVKLIEKTLDANGEVANIRNATDKVWVGVELYRRWQDKELQRTNILNGRSYKETVEELSSRAEKIVVEFLNTASVDHFLMNNPLKWPSKVLAANSMYRITQTFLQAHEHDNLLITGDEEKIYDCLSVMISDILAACLTNLPQVIIKKCHSNEIKERAKNVREAAILLGESEEILQIVQQIEFPSNINPEKAAYIEEWRTVTENNRVDLMASLSASDDRNSSVVQANGSEHVSIEVHEG